MERFAGSSLGGCSSLQFIKKQFEFDDQLRRYLLFNGSKLILSSFRECPLRREHLPLLDRAKGCQIDLSSGSVTSVCICPLGSARSTKETLLRLEGVCSHLDFLWDQELSRFHIVRFIGDQNDLGTIARLREFRRMVTILLNSGAEIITGTAASSNDPAVRMDEGGNWRFQRLPTVWRGISVSRLEKLWMRMGFIPERLLGVNSSKLALLSPENVGILSEEFKTRCPDSPSPFHYLCPKVSIYDHATL